MLEARHQDIAKYCCSVCGTTATLDLYEGELGRPTDVEALQQARERLGWMFTPNKKFGYCPQCGPQARVEALEALETIHPDTPEPPLNPVQAIQGDLGVSGIPAKPRSLS